MKTGKLRAGNREQRAGSKEQRKTGKLKADNREQRAKSR
jgi:hypothetical protein